MDIISPQDELAALIALHRWYETMGVDDAVSDVPRNYFAEKSRPEPELEAAQPPRRAALPELRPELRQDKPEARPPRPALSAVSLSPEAALAEAKSRAAAAQTLNELAAALESFEGCSIKRTAMNMIFGGLAETATEPPRIMVIGETPDADDDKSGRAFSGPRGVFLRNVLAAVGWHSSAYLTFLVPWRPAGNSMPPPHDIDACLPFMERHIALLKPARLLCLGWSAAKLNVGRDLLYKGEAGDIPVTILPELHELMRSAARKKKAWEELRALTAK